jgi:hypothetical protein
MPLHLLRLDCRAPSHFVAVITLISSGVWCGTRLWPSRVGDDARFARAHGADLGEAACPAVLNALIDTKPAATWPPPCEVPSALRAAFEGPDGSMPLAKGWCLAQRYEGELVVDWSAKFVDDYCAGIASGANEGSYKLADVALVRDAIKAHLPGVAASTGVVLGSERPWVECLALEAGAATVWTFEYATIKSTHPRVRAKPMKEMAADALGGAAPRFDWALTYSSLEHSGLGRYGDALNPDGDRLAVQQAWCMLKPGGFLVIGVPTTCALDGNLVFNAHRNYGFRRLAYIAAGFELVEITRKCTDQSSDVACSIFVLRKPAVGMIARPLTGEDFERAVAARASE